MLTRLNLLCTGTRSQRVPDNLRWARPRPLPPPPPWWNSSRQSCNQNKLHHHHHHHQQLSGEKFTSGSGNCISLQSLYSDASLSLNVNWISACTTFVARPLKLFKRTKVDGSRVETKKVWRTTVRKTSAHVFRSPPTATHLYLQSLHYSCQDVIEMFFVCFFPMAEVNEAGGLASESANRPSNETSGNSLSNAGRVNKHKSASETQLVEVFFISVCAS